MASPHVAGAAALILDAAPSSTPADVARVLAASATQGVVTNLGDGSPNLLLYIGADRPVPSSPSTSTTAPATPAPAAAPSTVVETPTTTTAPQSPASSVDTSTTVTPTTVAPQSVGVRSVALGNVEEPAATIVRSGADKVLVRITNARGLVDVMVNGKVVLKTKKRVILIKSKGVAAKRVTVRASKSN